MTATAAPFGFRPSYHPTGLDRGIRRTIASAYGSNIFKGSPVILATTGAITIGTAAADLLGIFNGVEYIDTNGKPNYSPYWPAGQTVQTGSAPAAYVWEDALIVYDVQANGPLAATSVGDQADVVNPGNGSTQTGTSTAALSTTLAGAGAQAQFRIMGLSLGQDNAWGDLFTIVQVQLARHQFVANKVAI